jgi:hypothetical protein
MESQLWAACTDGRYRLPLLWEAIASLVPATEPLETGILRRLDDASLAGLPILVALTANFVDNTAALSKKVDRDTPCTRAAADLQLTSNK